MRRLIAALAVCAVTAAAQTPPPSFLPLTSKRVALTHVRVIDGTGAPARAGQTILVRDGLIEAVGNAADITVPAGYETLDLPGHTVIPGLVGMHEHLFYPSANPVYSEMAVSFPRLYLASGVTTARTGGGLENHTDLTVKKWIDEGRPGWVGPDLHITAGYLEGPGAFTPQMLELRKPNDAKAFVDYWALVGATSFKAYMHITRAELAAAVKAAHARRLQVAGHLCSVGFREAAAIGIDTLEHGLIEDGEIVPGKKPDQCPDITPAILENLDIQGDLVKQIIRDLVQHHVAITSTLAVFEVAPPIQQRFLDALSPQTAANYQASRDRLSENSRHRSELEVKKEQEFERAFVAAGGLLVAGADPTGNGSTLAGYGDQRNIELLVGAGFTHVQAIQIATLNGAQQLGISKQTGSVAAGKQADLAVIEGDPSANIEDIRNVRIVFRKGIAYDSAKLIESVKGLVGLR